MRENLIKLGKVIAEERLSRNMSQESLSAFAGMARSHLAMIEAGKTSPTVETLWRIAEALEVKLSELMRRCE